MKRNRKLKIAVLLAVLASPLAAMSAHAQVATIVPPLVGAQQGTATASMVSVPVLKEPVPKGGLIKAENITQKQVESAKVFTSTVQEASFLEGLQANRALPAGQPVNKLHVDVAPMVRRGGAVTLHYVRGGIELIGQGQALEDGQVGQAVRVLNPSTRTTLMGRVTAGGAVEIN